MDSLKLKFKSSNNVPVSEARITRQEFEDVEKLETENAELRKGFTTLDNLLTLTRSNYNDLLIEREKYKTDNAELSAHIERLKELFNTTTSDHWFAALHIAFKEAPQISLAKHDAKVIREMLDILDGALHYEAKEPILDYALQLEKDDE